MRIFWYNVSGVRRFGCQFFIWGEDVWVSGLIQGESIWVPVLIRGADILEHVLVLSDDMWVSFFALGSNICG